MTLLATLFSRLRQFRFERRGVACGSGCSMARGVDLQPGIRNRQSGTISIGPRGQLEAGAIIHAWGGTVKLSEDVFVGPYAVIYGHGGVEIGEHTLVSMHCRILSSNHTVPAVGEMIRFHPDVLLPTKIGRDVWLGAGVTVLGGVTIGDGCVVGAGAVVTSDLPPHSIAYGVPARVVDSRPPR
jgi:acetyltransferase-like isoleucine patch superfamily enzyme